MRKKGRFLYSYRGFCIDNFLKIFYNFDIERENLQIFRLAFLCFYKMFNIREAFI